MRGSLFLANPDDKAVGIIPAHAGLTLLSLLRPAHLWDHPRACGAHCLCIYRRECQWGSSPRMRGSRSVANADSRPPGIIPAHAGLTKNRRSSGYNPLDHPRACGAHGAGRALTALRPGSSPRMRGSRLFLSVEVQRDGIIPAHAGLTVSPSIRASAVRDHPRACGAHPSLEKINENGEGSSPRMRGSREDCRPRVAPHGIIPAHAGLTNTAFAKS